MAARDYPVQPIPSHHGSIPPPVVPPGAPPGVPPYFPPGPVPPEEVPMGSPEEIMVPVTGAVSTALGSTSGTSLESVKGMSSNERNMRIFYLISLIIVSIVVFLGVFIVIIGPDRNDIFTETPSTTPEEYYVPVTVKGGGRIYFETNETDSAAAAQPNASSADSDCVPADNLTHCVMPVGRMFACVRLPAESRRCREWDANLHCLKSPHFASVTECMDACGRGDPSSCPAAVSCSCSGDFRLTNWVLEPVAGCRRLNDNHCVAPSEGFPDGTTCNETCGDVREREFDSRCNGSYVLRPCTLMDRRYRFFWDSKTNSCQSWEKTTCLLGAYEDYESCSQNCG